MCDLRATAFTVRDGHSGCFATHERRVDEIVARLRPAELEQVIKLVGQGPETNAGAGAGREHFQRSGVWQTPKPNH
jgi:hypothetical protein